MQAGLKPELSIGSGRSGCREIGVDGIRGQAAEIRDGVRLRLFGGESLRGSPACGCWLALFPGVAEAET